MEVALSQRPASCARRFAPNVQVGAGGDGVAGVLMAQFSGKSCRRPGAGWRHAKPGSPATRLTLLPAGQAAR